MPSCATKSRLSNFALAKNRDPQTRNEPRERDSAILLPYEEQDHASLPPRPRIRHLGTRKPSPDTFRTGAHSHRVRVATHQLSTCPPHKPYHNPTTRPYRNPAGQPPEHQPQVTASWHQVHREMDEDTVQIHIAIKHDLAASSELREVLARVSDPKHQSYGKYLSIEEIGDIIRPPASRLDAVLDWLETNQLTGQVNAYGDFVTVRGSASSLNKLFDTKLALWAWQTDDADHDQVRVHLRSVAGHTVPTALAPHVDFVAGLSEPFPSRTTKRAPREGRDASKQPPVAVADDDDDDSGLSCDNAGKCPPPKKKWVHPPSCSNSSFTTRHAWISPLREWPYASVPPLPLRYQHEGQR